MEFLSAEQSAEVWRIAILLMKADGKESLTYNQFKNYIELVDIDDVKKKMPGGWVSDDPDQTILHQVRSAAAKLNCMRKKWEFLRKLTYREVLAHELFPLCNTYANWTDTTKNDPEILAYAMQLVEDGEEENE